MQTITTTGLPIMAHLVLGYPSLAESIRSAETYIKTGIQVLELQIPFSHPTADGPVITAACQEAVEQQGVSVQDAIDAIRTIRTKYPEQEIIVMSYLNRVMSYGPETFGFEMRNLGVRHLIIPDLPVDSPLALRYFQPGKNKPVLAPVLAANVSDSRLAKLLDLDFDFFYLMSDFKITGATFSLHPRLKSVIAQIRAARPEARVGIGFGISTPAQARAALEDADMAIIGSALIKARQQGRLELYLQELSTLQVTG